MLNGDDRGTWFLLGQHGTSSRKLGDKDEVFALDLWVPVLRDTASLVCVILSLFVGQTDGDG